MLKGGLGFRKISLIGALLRKWLWRFPEERYNHVSGVHALNIVYYFIREYDHKKGNKLCTFWDQVQDFSTHP